MHNKKILLFLLLSFLFISTKPCDAFIVINEFLADPSSVDLLGDANGDGINSSSQDEFVEFVNAGTQSVDISLWSLADALKARHYFDPGTIMAPGEYLVVFGGGIPALEGVRAQVASTGTLGLNNTGDEIFLYDDLGNLKDYYQYGREGNLDQSLVRSPEITGEDCVLHSSVLEGDGSLFSPGMPVGGYVIEAPVPLATTVPELTTFLYLNMGILGMLLGRRRFQGLSGEPVIRD